MRPIDHYAAALELARKSERCTLGSQEHLGLVASAALHAALATAGATLISAGVSYLPHVGDPDAELQRRPQVPSAIQSLKDAANGDRAQPA